MAAVALRREERIGLAVAVAAHAALVALLIWRPHAAPVVTPPDRIEVTISDEVGLKSTSPQPQAKAAPDIAPELGEPPLPAPAPAPPVPQVEPRIAPPPPEPVKPKPLPKPEPRPIASPRPAPRPEPRPVPKPILRPELPRPVAKPAMRPEPRPTAAPAHHPVARPSAASDPIGAALREAKKPTTRPGGSRIGADFLKGVGTQADGTSRNPPAAAISASEKASLLAAISRKVRPNWRPPQGADGEKLVTVLRWNLNSDGSLAGPVEFIRQEGRTDANRPQWDRHKEMAIRAVELAAPFDDLPPRLYSVWKRVGPINFDWKLAQ